MFQFKNFSFDQNLYKAFYNQFFVTNACFLKKILKLLTPNGLKFDELPIE